MLPEGRVTFLFTDIEGSTRLFRRLGDDYVALLDQHDRALRNAIEGHNGVVVKTEGDAFFAAFAEGPDGVRAAVAGQSGLQAVSAPDGSPVRVRMGLHTGLAYPRNNDYVALAVHQAARIAAAGHGGQIVVSDTTVATLGSSPSGIEIDDLGAYRLKDFDEPTRLFAVRGPGMDTSLPPLRAVPESRGNLPDAVGSFIGREADLVSAQTALRSNRIVTIAGPGGAGKTRLAIELGHDGLQREKWEVAWFVDLTSATADESAASVICAALGVDVDSTIDRIGDYLTTRRALVVMDNCEHIVDSVRDVLLHMSPDGASTFLLTSQMPVGVRGEHVVRLGPLVDEAALELFADRIAESRKAPLTRAERGVAERICRALDGLPLALELAAARAEMLSLSDIADRLDERLRLLRSKAHPTRHQTLESTIDWSYTLCSQDEQLLLGRLGAFTGSFTLRLAEWAAGIAPLDELDVLDLVASLVDRSLVQVDDLVGQTRYRLLESVRAFALKKLDASGEAPIIASRVLERVIDDDAARFAVVTPSAAVDDDLTTIEATLTSGNVTGDVLAKAAIRVSAHHRAHGNNRHGLELLRRILDRLPDDADGRADVLAAGAAHAVELDDLAAASDLVERSEAIAAPDDQDLRAWLDGRRGLLALHRRDLVAAKTELQRALARDPSPHVRATALANLSLVEVEQGEYETALPLVSEAAGLFEHLGALWEQSQCLGNLAELWTRLGDDAIALRHELHALRLRAELGAMDGIATSLIGIGRIAQRRGAAPAAVELLSVGAMLLDETGTVMYPSDQILVEESLVELREQLGPDDFHEHWQAARQRDVESAITQARAIT